MNKIIYNRIKLHKNENNSDSLNKVTSISNTLDSIINNNNKSLLVYKKDTIIILLRGHIRDSFNDNNLFNLILNLSYKYNLEIYIHTWNKKSNNISWREVKENNEMINKTTILNYFKYLSKYIVYLIIDDDSNIIINGNKEGSLFSSCLPIIGWKNMWYGMKKIMDVIDRENKKLLIFNTRFDVLKNSNSIYSDILIEWIIQRMNEITSNNIKIKKNYFLNLNNSGLGIDNHIIGDTYTMKKLIDHFNNLDDFIDNYKNIINQEHVVFFENDKIF